MPGSIEVWHLLLPLWGKVGMGICLEDKKIGRYDNRKVSYLPLINLVPSPTRGANLRTDDAKLVRIARKLSKLEPKVLLRNFPSVEQIQDKVPKTGWGAVRRVGRYNKNKSFQWKIENGKSLPSSSAEGWRSSRLRKTSWVPELRSRTTSAILKCLFTSIHPYL